MFNVKVASIVVWSVVINLLVVLPLGYWVFYKRQQSFGTVDLQYLIQQEQDKWFKQLQAAGGQQMNSQTNLVLTQQFAQKLDKAVGEVASECKCVLLNKAALLTPNTGGITDYTQAVYERVGK